MLTGSAWALVFALCGGVYETAHGAPLAPQKEWTLLVFMNGKNDLDDNATRDLLEMQKVGSNSNLNIVVEWGSAALKENRRVYIEKDVHAKTVTSPVVGLPGAVDMGKWQYLRDFLLWGTQNYPAKKYAVSIWNHGSGWHAAQFRVASKARTSQSPGTYHVNNISFDDLTGHSISTPGLGLALSAVAKSLGRPLDFVGTDACLMAMAEVAGELIGSAKYFGASEAIIPYDGWPYDKLLKLVIAKPSMDAREFSEDLSKTYIDSYSGFAADNVTFSVLDMDRFTDFSKAFRELAGEVAALSPAESKAWVKASRRAQTFTNDEYVDFGDYLYRLRLANLPSIRSATLDAASNALKDLVFQNVVSPAFSSATGLAFHLPSNLYIYDMYASDYRLLEFDRETGWSAALERVLVSSTYAP